MIDYDVCGDQLGMIKVLRNTLLTQDSELSHYLGFHMTTYSNLDLAGVQYLMYSLVLHLAQYFELLMTIFLHIDVIVTIKNPFYRSIRLE